MPSNPEIPAPAQPARGVERLFPFVLRSRSLLVGRESLRHRKGRVQFVLITTDLSENSRAEIISQFSELPIVQRFTSDELRTFFGIHNAKVIGFEKSGLARSILNELREHRIHEPAPAPPRSTTPPASPAATKAPPEPRRHPRFHPSRRKLPPAS